jgi:uncharacterized membrane protein
MKNFSARKITQAAAIAAIYIVLTYITNLFGLANGVVQVRVSEALAVLPYYTATSIPGLFIGCLLSNILTGCIAMDVIFGSIATLIGAVAGRYLSKINKYLTPVPTIISNMLIVPLVLKYAYGIPGSVWYFMLTVGAGEIISCCVIGIPFMLFLEKHHPERLFE